jgi:hypothetical protein
MLVGTGTPVVQGPGMATSHHAVNPVSSELTERPSTECELRRRISWCVLYCEYLFSVSIEQQYSITIPESGQQLRIVGPGRAFYSHLVE